MNNYLVFCLAALCCSCSTVKDGYEVERQDSRAVHQASQTMNKDIWHRILMVKYKDGNTLKQAEYLVFMSPAGKLYAYNSNGTSQLVNTGDNATKIANYLVRNVIEAYYE